MKMKRRCMLILVVIILLGALYTSVCAASSDVAVSSSPDVSVSTNEIEETASPVPSELPEETGSNRSKQWIFFAVTSVLSLALAIPLAIRSGNKKYGK